MANEEQTEIQTGAASSEHGDFSKRSTGLLWCRINQFLQLPPDCFTYLYDMNLLAEMIFAIIFFAVGRAAATKFELTELNVRPIPYQTTAAGDVLLDLELSNPHIQDQTVSGSMASLLCIVLPILALSAFSFSYGPPRDLHAFLCFYLVAGGANSFITEFLKLYVGRLRPNFYDFCQFDSDLLDCTAQGTEGRKSFPSGHASLAFVSMTVVSLYFLGKVGLQRNDVTFAFLKDWTLMFSSSLPQQQQQRQFYDDVPIAPSFAKKLIALLSVITPMFFATFIAASRVRDNWHHPADVLAGSIIGASCALFVHGLWYPPVTSKYAGIPLQALSLITEEVSDGGHYDACTTP